MNRIILIGNGFDLAHGLKTSYADFIDWYWKEWNLRLKGSFNSDEEDELCSFKLKNDLRSSGWYNTWVYRLQLPLNLDRDIDVLTIAKLDRELCDFTIKSPFFETICEEVETKNWVDIEDVYYEFLKKSDNPKQLNEDLDFIKSKLVQYLSSLPEPTLNPIIRHQILKPIAQEDFAVESKNQWDGMVKARVIWGKIGWQQLVEVYNAAYAKHSYDAAAISQFCQSNRENIFAVGDICKQCPGFLLPDNILLLNFNYTDIADRYVHGLYRFPVNHIHGSLSNPQGVIFGYGDEHDDEYQPLMKKNDNEYLRHIKSFRYLEAANYRKMLSFIEMDAYQVCIMGHSCGISDRTLLKKLFEHKNCVSIKPYYHQKKDGTDDYWDIVCNIARNISDPSLMRDRVVIKEHCEPLSQLPQNTQNR